jgi:hypothetical protein
MRALVLILILFFSFEITFADPLEKGFERLKVFDFFQAKMNFEKALKNKTAGASYGLSLIYASDKNPFYNLDSARHYILFADSAFRLSTAKQITAYQQLDITAANIAFQKNLICSKAFSVAEKDSSVETFNWFLKYFGFCEMEEEAVRLRNKAAFKNARLKHTAQAYQEFITLYPQAEEISEARTLLDESIYNEITIQKNVLGYKEYLLQYPDGPYKLQAEKMIYQLSTLRHSLSDYDAFIKKYPQSYYLNDAWRELYKLAMKEFSEESYNNFKKSYPGYPFMEELEENFKLMNSQLLPFEKNDLWGYINEDGKEIIKPLYEENSFFSEGLAAVKQNGKYGYINKSGKLIIPFAYDEAEPFLNKTAVVSGDKKFGLINQVGDTLINIQYDDLTDPVEDISIGIIDEQSGYISKTGKKITEFIYDVAGDFKDGFSIFGIDDKFGILGKNGKQVIKPDYDQILYIENGLFRARKNNMWGIITGSGEIIVPFIYNMISDFSEGKALVVKKAKCGVINQEGKIIVPLNYIFSENLLNTALFKNGYMLIRQKIKSVLIDSSGTKFNASNFEDIGMPGDNLIPVKKNKKWGYITATGKVKIPVKFQSADAFENNIARIIIKGKTGVIDTSGITIVPAIYDEVIIKKNCFIVKEKGMAGLLSSNGTFLLHDDYDKINLITEKTAEAIKNDKKSYINIFTGKIILKDN